MWPFVREMSVKWIDSDPNVRKHRRETGAPDVMEIEAQISTNSNVFISLERDEFKRGKR